MTLKVITAAETV